MRIDYTKAIVAQASGYAPGTSPHPPGADTTERQYTLDQRTDNK